MDKELKKTLCSPQIISIAIIAISLIISSLFVSCGLSNISNKTRKVCVRGLAEREVDADMAIWPVTFSLGSNDLFSLQKDISAKTNSVTQFLEECGLSKESYNVQDAAITDMATNMYSKEGEYQWKYIAKVTVLVRTFEIKKINLALSQSLKLLSKGVPISKDYENRIQYIFTALNKIKPEMIAQATKNARAAAEQFARDSKSKLGKIKSANQGLFTIEDAAPNLSERKKIRVVTMVEYILK